ncbi:MAG: glycosyltransferase family 9 protein, partial [Gemmatimonadaceae bacterium]
RTTLVAMHPSARQVVRRWALDRFAEVVTAIGAIPDTRVLVLVDPDGYGETLETAGAICIRASLAELPAYLRRCAVFVGNDSGPAHIAAAVGATTVTIFGPGAIQWFRPYGPGQRVVYVSPMRCRPCFDHCTRSQNFCLTTLPVDRVLGEVRMALASRVADSLRAVDLTPVASEIRA